jgi:hypothetical protein
MDFVTVTYMGIIFALQSYRNIFFLVRTTEFLSPVVMTYECYFLLKFRIKNGGRERAQAQTQRRQTITAITIHHRTTSHLCAMRAAPCMHQQIGNDRLSYYLNGR